MKKCIKATAMLIVAIGICALASSCASNNYGGQGGGYSGGGGHSGGY